MFRFKFGNNPFKSEKLLPCPYQTIVDVDGNIFCADRLANNILVFQPDGRFLRSVDGDFSGPVALTFDLEGEDLYVLDYYGDQHVQVG